MQIKINGKIYRTEKTGTILEVCRDLKVEIPTLCHHGDLSASEGLCRLCLVKTNCHKGLVASCQTPAKDYLEVLTQDQDIQKARKWNLELLWADHAGKCSKCQRNGNCELQKLAREFEIDINDFIPDWKHSSKESQLLALKESLKNRVVDDQNSCLVRDNQYCIECRRCVKACREIQTVDSYGTNYRSIETKVGTPGEIPLDCVFCGQCANYCPTGAIVEKDETKKMEELLADKNKLKVFQFAPSARFTLGEEFGLAPGTFVEGKLVALLRKLGADLVFDTTFSADLTIVEEANELAERILAKVSGKKKSVLPMFTSCCPSWVLYVEKYYPEFIPNLSSCKSPQQMMGALLKTYYPEKKKIHPENIVSLSIMPCIAKKFEAQRREMGRKKMADVDLVLTVRELARLCRRKGIDFNALPEEKTDSILGDYTGAGILFASSGGVMEAALRTAYEKLTCGKLEKLDFKEVRGVKGIREAEIVFPKSKCLVKELKIKVAVAHKLVNAKKILESLKKGECDYDFVEVMACPDGCLGGGGQPIPSDSAVREKRKKAIYALDANLPKRKSHENQALQKVYEEYLENPGSVLAEEFLHTGYENRKKN